MLDIGLPEDFQTVRRFLSEVYTEPELCPALGVTNLREFDRMSAAQVDNTLARLFFIGSYVSEAQLKAAVPDAVVASMSSLGLLERDGSLYFSPVILYPTRGLQLVSDRFTKPSGEILNPDRHFVYFALTPNTQNFLDMLPMRPCEAFLDVGTGNGAGALLCSRVSRKAWGSDIDPKSVHYARFNQALNGITNAEIVEGSLYEPVQALTFDRIAAHPPYDFSVSSNWTFADGGDDGEFVVRGIISGLPQMLRQGGQFYSLFRAADVQGTPLEQRIRGWLGPQQGSEFDIAVVTRSFASAEEYAITAAMTASRKLEDYEALIERFRSLHVERLAYSSVLIERKADAGRPITVRRQMGERCTSGDLEWLLEWERTAPSLDFAGLRLVAAPGLDVLTRHRMREGELRPVEYRLKIAAPFEEEMECPAWVAYLVSKCSGSRSTGELFELIRQTGPIQPSEFEAALRKLLAAGALQLASGSPVN
jgi:SAM-dependent methyltransferase